MTLKINRVPDSLMDQICTKFGQNPLKDVDPRVFTRIVTDGRTEGRTDSSVTISPRNFVGEGITSLCIDFIVDTVCYLSYVITSQIYRIATHLKRLKCIMFCYLTNDL